MGNWNIDIEERNIRLFNSPVELGLRCLFLLSSFKDDFLSLEKLIYLDYFLIHANDISKKRKSIHPKYPFRTTEIVVKRELLISALRLLISKELIEVAFTESGIQYKVTDIGNKALEYFESDYANQVKETSNWLHKTYREYSEQQLSDLIAPNMQKWGSEFSNEAKFRTF